MSFTVRPGGGLLAELGGLYQYPAKRHLLEQGHLDLSNCFPAQPSHRPSFFHALGLSARIRDTLDQERYKYDDHTPEMQHLTALRLGLASDWPDSTPRRMSKVDNSRTAPCRVLRRWGDVLRRSGTLPGAKLLLQRLQGCMLVT